MISFLIADGDFLHCSILRYRDGVVIIVPCHVDLLSVTHTVMYQGSLSGDDDADPLCGRQTDHPRSTGRIRSSGKYRIRITSSFYVLTQ